MSSDKKSSFASPFDEMLEKNWRQFETLYDGGGRSSRPAPQVTPLASTPAESDTIRFLNDRYGNGWRYEVTDRRREGDEVIVLCKLVIADQDIAKTQFGRARIGSTDASAIKGSADGVSFAIGPRGATAGGNSESAAYERAVDRALAKCVEML